MKAALMRLMGLACLALPCLAFAQGADLLLVNGRIVTLDPKGSVRQALAVRDGRIAATETFISQPGESDDLRRQTQDENIAWYEAISADIFT